MEKEIREFNQLTPVVLMSSAQGERGRAAAADGLSSEVSSMTGHVPNYEAALSD